MYKIDVGVMKKIIQDSAHTLIGKVALAAQKANEKPKPKVIYKNVHQAKENGDGEKSTVA